MTMINVEFIQKLEKSSDNAINGYLALYKKDELLGMIALKNLEMEENMQEDVKDKDFQDLIQGVMQPHYCKVYQEEIKKCIKRCKNNMEKLETVQYTPDENLSLVNFNEIMEIADICHKNYINEEIQEVDNDGKHFHTTIEKVPGKVTIYITCNNKLGLNISFATVYDRISHSFITTIFFSYCEYPVKKSVSFIATDSCNICNCNPYGSPDERTNYATLSKTLIPITPEGSKVLWSEVRDYKILNQQDLRFVISMLSQNIKKDEEEKETAKN